MPPVGGPAVERLLAREVLTQPQPRGEVGRDGLVRVEVAAERQQHERVLLGGGPSACRPVPQQPCHELGYEVAGRLVRDQRLEDDRVGAPVRDQLQLIAFGAPVRACTRAPHPGFESAAVRSPVAVGRLDDHRPPAGREAVERHAQRVSPAESRPLDGLGDHRGRSAAARCRRPTAARWCPNPRRRCGARRG